MRGNKKSNSFNKVIRWITIITVISILLLFVGGYLYINNIINKVEEVEINTDNESIGIKDETEKEFKEIRNIALFGIDARDEDLVGRSDVIIILTLDGVHNKIKITSIMRDSYVNIDGYGMDKINHAFSYGGVELALKTINSNFDLNIKEAVVVNFSSLIELIDILGGININIEEEEIGYIPGIITPGEQLLNGNQALAYSRLRYTAGGDYKRTERQRIVIDTIFNKLKDTPINKYPELINKLLPYVQTNMSTAELLKLGIEFGSLKSKNLEQNRYPKDNQLSSEMIDGINYLTFDLEEVKNSIRDYIFNDK